MASQKPFSFFDLIPELRNHVYDILFADHVVDLESSRYKVPGLLLASKQAFAEAHGPYYRQSEFRSVSSAVAEKRLSTLNPSYTPLIEHIKIDMVSRVSELYGPGQSMFSRNESEDEELFETAYLAQCAVFWVRQGLEEQGCGLSNSDAIMASIKLGQGQTLFTATPFETFHEGVVEQTSHKSESQPHANIVALVQAQARYLDFDHANPRKCWHRLWSSDLKSTPYECKCPRKGAKPEKSTTTFRASEARDQSTTAD